MLPYLRVTREKLQVDSTGHAKGLLNSSYKYSVLYRQRFKENTRKEGVLNDKPDLGSWQTQQ